ncbi:carboxypeptidase-like regulatory domain-containing protein [Occallatibacter riparius]|uniref:Carboxypeptidase-like regulatory domain-containing protein n=1 Tax=Occallatibacter riparius TaxID=1002689 RepID=A0A9J7BSD5_9BACT|nr:carboxypeptidase-like regulatory domain-containing protein [Occallatibacter riparius]UWZ85503.1 carboxypeptidase-like regulatory domain-containing protein [Occallatibacter riparius]
MPAVTSMRIGALWICAWMISAGAMAAQTPGILRGKVLDPSEAVVGQAHVLIHSERPGSYKRTIATNQWVDTDGAGSFEAQLAPGVYDVCVMFSIFLPSCSRIEIKTEGVTMRTIKMKVDPKLRSVE